MGCSGILPHKWDKNNQFYKEALGFRENKLKGLRIDDDIDITNQFNIEKYDNIDIKIENYTHGDESASVKPWLENIICPDQLFEEDLNYPNYTLSVEHVFGLRLEDTRQDLFYLSKEELLYISSGLAVIQNIDDYSQIIFGGFENESENDCHDNVITSIDFMKNNVSFVATGQRGIKPKILVWSPFDPSIVFATFEQPKGSKEVTGLSFDCNGHYLASFGKDENNTFYIWDLRTKSLHWSQNTGKNDNKFLFDIKFENDEKQVCICGINKIIFGAISLKKYNNVYHEKNNENIIFTKCCYVHDKYWFIGNDRGEIHSYRNQKLHKIKYISSGSVQCIIYKEQFRKVYVSDSLNYVYLLEDHGNYNTIEKFINNSIVKSLDVNEEENILMGLKNGQIIIKHMKDPIKREEIFIESHSEAQIGGLVFVPENRVLTSGLDNKILLYNLRSKKCESTGQINPINPNAINNNNSTSGNRLFNKKNHQSLAIAYEENKGHVAVGINNGKISIRKGIKDLDIRIVNDIKIGEGAILELKYTNYGDLLVGSTESKEVVFLNTNEKYEIIKNIKFDFSLISFDFDSTYQYLQAVTNDNQYIFIDVNEYKQTKDTNFVKNADWPTLTCKFGFTVQGIYLGSTDPDYINSVGRANALNLICSGRFDFKLNLMNYPTIQDAPKYYSYRGHSGKIRRIVWTPEDDKILTIAEDDHALILWNVNEVKEGYEF